MNLFWKIYVRTNSGSFENKEEDRQNRRSSSAYRLSLYYKVSFVFFCNPERVRLPQSFLPRIKYQNP